MLQLIRFFGSPRLGSCLCRVRLPKSTTMFQRRNGSLGLEENDQITQKEKVSGDHIYAFQCIILIRWLYLCVIMILDLWNCCIYNTLFKFESLHRLFLGRWRSSELQLEQWKVAVNNFAQMLVCGDTWKPGAGTLTKQEKCWMKPWSGDQYLNPRKFAGYHPHTLFDMCLHNFYYFNLSVLALCYPRTLQKLK